MFGRSGSATCRANRLNLFLRFFPAAIFLLCAVSPAFADHSKMDPNASCYACHTLKASEVLSSTRSIRTSKPKLTKLADNTAWAAGMPLSCDFCHQAATDVPSLMKSTKTSRHPVDTIGNETDPSREISCNDCHNAYWDSSVPANDNHEVTPKTLLLADNTDGYPDHKGLGSDNQYSHNLRSNPPHLSKGYTGTLNFSSTTPRVSDGTFWSQSLDGGNLVCFICHGGSSYQPPYRGASGRSQYNIMSDYAAGGTTGGHRINANFGGSGALPQGSKLPCYDCHSSHGSVSRRLILDGYFPSDNGMRNIEGTSSLAVNTFTGTTPGPTGDIAVCAGCHNTGLSATAFSGTGKVEKLNPMDPFVSKASSHAPVGSWASPSTTKGCLSTFSGCHASPHNPIGESLGGLACGICHTSIYNAMQSTSGYHHVMLADNATGTYPTNAAPGSTPSDRTCRICHVDHDLFSTRVNANYLRARNLRQSISVQPNDNIPAQAPLNTDYDNTLGGVCTSCHVNVQTKSSTNIKYDNVSLTAVVSQSYYGYSAHNYAVTSPYIRSHFSSDNSAATSIFRANCSKCHNDTMQKSFQDNNVSYPNQFGLHDSGAGGGSAVDKLLGPLGATAVAEVAGENFCYRCHSLSTDSLPNGPSKPQSGYDWYGSSIKSMTSASELVFGEFQKTSRHPVKAADQKSGTAVVSCGNCHNPHNVGRTSDNLAISNPDNTYASAVYTTMAGRLSFCIACHDGSPPDNTVSATRLVPARVRADNAAMNKSSYQARSHVTAGQGQMFMSVLCTNCHDRHGGSFGKLLDNGVKYHRGPTWSPPACTTCHVFVTPSPATGNNNSECFRCHTYQGTGYPAIESDRTSGDNGYFAALGSSTRFSRRYPGKTVYEGSYSPHNNTAKTFSGFDNVTRQVSDCKSCHDVHGTANPYAQLKGTYRAGNYTLCFQCHGKTATAADNITRYYPTAAGGDNTDSPNTTNAGHNIKTAGGYLPQYAALPCYDCHVTHGSKNLNTQLKSDQTERGWSSLGDTKFGSTPSDNAADNNSRRFCFGCHVASDGSGTSTVENLSQAGSNKLKLPSTYGIEEHKASGGQGCQRCHYGRNYNDNTYGPHYPATGLCDTCHESQGTKSAAAVSYNGGHKKHVDNTTYRFACKECHSWTKGSGQAVHKNDNSATAIHAEVAFDNQGSSNWDNIYYAVSTAYKYRSLYTNPYGVNLGSPSWSGGVDNGTDAKQSLVKWKNGSCSNVWCHSTAYSDNVARTVAWVEGGLPSDCTGCHGGGSGVAAASRMGAANNGSPAHLAHINSNLKCYKCHYGTVTSTSQDNVIAVYDNHVNGVKNVRLASDVGGTYDNSNKTCSATYCHGTPAPLPDWDNVSTVSGCSSCHQSQGAGSGTATYTGAHAKHADNAAGGRYLFACEACHARSAASQANGVHAGGDDNTSGPRTVDLKFTDNIFSSWTYDAGSRTYRSFDFWTNPYGAAAPSPGYADNSALGGTDTQNGSITWTIGNCSNVWCHSNANPASSGGGANTYRSPSWAGSVACTSCHLGRDTYANMGAASDRLSRGHRLHLATDRYNYTCDECHARTVPADCTAVIADPGGFAYHVNGSKTDIFGSVGVKTSPVVDNLFTYDSGARTCSNVYCHSFGVDNNVSGGFDNAAVTPRWDNEVTTCTSCHGGNGASASPMATGSHTTHVLTKGFRCSKCHYGTVTDNTLDNVINIFDNHVNGTKNIRFSPDISSEFGGTYTSSDKSCRNIYCHGSDPWDDAPDSHPVPRWGVPSSVPNCGACHVDQGAGSPYNWRKLELHHPHSATAYPNLDPNNIRIACEVCHAQKSVNPGLHPNVYHGGGDDNVSSWRTAEVKFTDNGADQVYPALTFLSKDMWTNPFTGAGVTPTYAEGSYTPGDNDTHNKYLRWTNGTCGTTWCHSNAAPLGWKGVAGSNVYRSPKWSDSQVGPSGGACYYCHIDPMREAWGGDPRNMSFCDHCHRGKAAAAAMAGADNLSNAHITHVATDRYNFTCDECHAWTVVNDNLSKIITGAGHDNHVNGIKTVKFGTTLRTTTVDQSGGSYDNSAYRCFNTYCHSRGRDTAATNASGTGFAQAGGQPVDNTIAWNSATGSRADCTTCHGGRQSSQSPMATGSHTAHVSSNIRCYKCHYGTVTSTTQDNAIAVIDNHVNGVKNVAFPSEVGGTWDNSNKTCSGTSCHGTPAPLPQWDNSSTVSGCGACHQNQGAGSTASYSATHHPHTTNNKLRIACETCHATNATAHPVAAHAGGPDNAATGMTAEVRYTDNSLGRTYGGIAFLSKNMWNNPYDGFASLTPTYTGGASSVGNDAVNPAIHWTQGTCSQVWCHSNARPLGGTNAFRTRTWSVTTCSTCHNPRPTDVNCTPCHRGVGTAAAMAGADNLSNVHILHAATDRYYFSCDECHAWTVMNDQHGTDGLGIIIGTGHDNHVDGVKTVKFGTTLRTTSINQSGGSYDNSAYRCYNTYCHSNGTDNATFNTSAQWPVDNTVSWDNATAVACRTCHRYTAASGNPMTSNAHDNHVNNYSRLGTYIACYTCHSGTVNSSDNLPRTPRSYMDNHVNGIRNVYFGSGIGTYDNTRTCSNTLCHQQGNALLSSLTPGDNLAPAWTDNWASLSTVCKGCHGSRTGTGYTNPSYYGEPNYDNNIGGSGARNSHRAHVTTSTGANCLTCHPDTVAAGTSIDNTKATMHMNDNVEVAPGNGETFTWNQGAKSCTNIACHGGNVTPVTWGTTGLGCESCHGAAAGLANFGYNDNVLAKIRIAGGWDNTGHGRTTGNYLSSNPPANTSSRFSTCVNYCHLDNNAVTPHTDNTAGSNYFRLATGGGAVPRTAIDCSTAINVCNQCHTTGGALTGQATRKVGTAHYGTKHTAPDNNGGYYCWDCHDPHGDGNDYMIQDCVAVKTDRGISGAGLGIPVTVIATSFTGSGTYTGSSYVKPTFDGLCQVCHAAGTGIAHYFNSAGGYDNGHNIGTRCTNCHRHDRNFEANCADCHDNNGAKLVSAPLVLWSGGARPSPPAGVTQGAYGSHLVVLKTDSAFSGTTNWNVQCNKCHSGHGGSSVNVQVPMPPSSWSDPSGRLTGANMRSRLGFDNGTWSYAADNGVWVGGTATSGSTEADICWNCHANAANNVSEWGPSDNNVSLSGFPVVRFPTQNDGTPTTFDYGWIWNSGYTSKVQDWTAGYWRDEYWWGAGTSGDPGLKRRIFSIHSASFDTAGQVSSVGQSGNLTCSPTDCCAINWASRTVENKAYIRCSYCHDVHDVKQAPSPFDNSTRFAATGFPFLRGSFKGNPYPPDMPPRAGNVYPSTGGPTQGSQAVGNRFRANSSGQVFGVATPRLFAYTYTSNDIKGGFFIDNNSGNPAATAGAGSNWYGLCAICHGTSIDNMKFYTGSSLWLTALGGGNGHGNSVFGGTGSLADNLFDARRGQSNKYMAMQDGVNVDKWGNNVNYDSNDQGVGGWWSVFGNPQPCDGSPSNCPPKNTGWYGGTPGSLTRGSGYATWYGNNIPKPAHQFICSKCHTPHASGLPSLLTTNCLDIGMSNWNANSDRVGPNADGTGSGNYWRNGPNNCHRNRQGSSRGWNKLAPMQNQ